jgi:hypothetical protein
MYHMGLGTTIANPGTEDYSTLCAYLPFADFLPVCKIPNTAQITQANLQNYGPAATPETIAAGQAAAVQEAQSYCQQFPADCAQYETAVASPITSAILGTGTVGQTVAKTMGGSAAVCDPTIDPTCAAAGCTESIVNGICDWWIYIGAGSLGLILVLAFSGTGRRR